ncbi:MAG: hypothetical protein GXO50_07225 [Chlorobi bacterium]|nr:hypothetical protein [Chlorobiota bacterium]
MSDIKILKNTEIDDILWDRCVARSPDGDVFGYSWYMDAVCTNWTGIVKGNYQAVMPLATHKLAGITLVGNTKFQHKTNIYSAKEIDEKTKNDFLNAAGSTGIFVKITSDNPYLSKKKHVSKINYSWKSDLIRPYKIAKPVKNGFAEKKITSAESENIFYNTGILPSGIALLSRLTKDLSKKDSETLNRLAAISLRKNLGQIYGAFNKHNKLTAAVLFIASHYKVNIIHAVQTKEAKKHNALYGLINHYIKQHSGKALTLDFFGLKNFSDNFFTETGAVKYPYFTIKL